MRGPPLGEKNGVASAPTPTTPDRASSLGCGIGNSARHYAIRRPSVNPQPVDAEPRGSAAGAAGAEDTGDTERVTAAERVFLEICLTQTGRELPEDIQDERNAARRMLLAQSYRIAEALESEGIPAYGPSNLSLVGVCSGQRVDLPDFRNIVFIPSVAQRKRHKMLKHLEYFIQAHPYSRMWVFTSGDRVTLCAVRERVELMHRRLSRLNAEPFMKSAGARIVFRSTELGEVARNDAGEPTFHIHAHAIVDIVNKLGVKQWTELLRDVRAWWKFHFKDSKQIEQAREACKYVVKPGDLDKLTSGELAELYRQLFRLHLVQCLGSLKEQRRMIEEDRKKLIRISDGKESRWKIVDDWNEYASRDDEDDGEEIELPHASPAEDWLLCTLPPSFALSGRAEPLAVVLNYTGQRLEKNRKFQMLRELCGPRFTADAIDAGR